MKKTLTGLAATLALMLGGASTSALAEDPFITVQSTTSTQNSGLYEYLLPLYKAKSGVDVHVVAVGTGQALKNAQNCDGDVVLVHAKSAEEKFVADGYGVKRTDLMYNDFIVVGAPADPAGVNGSKDTIDSFKKPPRRHSHRAAMTPAPTRRSSSSGRRPASTPRRTAADGTARPAPAWVPPSTPASAWAPTS